ncbi:type IV secretory system conjugative DNA transfer family protein [Halorientalis regularis]|nr:ATP-binding protein [Halorientalis regularis]
MSLLPDDSQPSAAQPSPTPADRVRSLGLGTDETGPLALLLRTMVTTRLPVIYQLLITPFRDWRQTKRNRIHDIDIAQDRVLAKFLGTDYEPGERDLTTEEQTRRHAIDVRNAAASYLVNARVAIPVDSASQEAADGVASDLESAFAHLGSDYHWLAGRRRCDNDGGNKQPGRTLFRRLRDRTHIDPEFTASHNWPTWRDNTSRGIIADAEELPGLFAIEGGSAPPRVERGLETTPPAQTPLTLPSTSTLDQFRQPGLALGYPIDSDHQRQEPHISVPPRFQTRHISWVGQTGSGKSTALSNALLANRTATAGPEILIDPKGGRMATELCQSLYAQTGSLDDVYYFDLAEWLPAQSFFDIRDEVAAGVQRSTAIEDRVGHFEAILRQLMGPEQYDAKLAPKAIRSGLRALYDPLHGDEVPTVRSLYETLRTLQDNKTPPPVESEALERSFASLAAKDDEVFQSAIGAALTRIEAITNRPRLRRLFNVDPTVEETPQFDFSAFLDEDVTIILDIGRLRESVQRAMVLIVLSQLWTALRRRGRRRGGESLPLVNVYLEEAGNVAGSEILDALLSEGREFQVSMTLAMQFPQQLADTDTRATTAGGDGATTYDEVLNNVGTIVTGQVGHDRKLAERLATDEIESEKMAARLRQLSAGQWLVSLPDELFEQASRPFHIESLPLPDGHPDATVSTPAGFQAAFDERVAHTRSTHAVTVADEPATAPETETDGATDDARSHPGINVLVRTTRLPGAVTYDPEQHAIQCARCERRYNPTSTGMRRALRCSGALETVDRNDIPICDLYLNRSADEIAALDWSRVQLAFLQAVYDAQQRRFAPHEYDIVWDSMLRLKEYLDIDQAAIDELLDAELLRHDGDHPHRLYSLSEAGRELIAEKPRSGLEFGHETGDLGESSLHTLMNEVLRRWIVQNYKQDDTSPVETVHTYYEVQEGELAAAAFMDDTGVPADADSITFRRLDVVGLDADGSIVVTGEAERIHGDKYEAIPDDFDTMAACEPEQAIWVVPRQSDGAEVLEGLNEPSDGRPRVETTYSTNSPPRKYQVDTAGLTDIYTVSKLLDDLED